MVTKTCMKNLLERGGSELYMIKYKEFMMQRSHTTSNAVEKRGIVIRNFNHTTFCICIEETYENALKATPSRTSEIALLRNRIRFAEIIDLCTEKEVLI